MPVCIKRLTSACIIKTNFTELLQYVARPQILRCEYLFSITICRNEVWYKVGPDLLIYSDTPDQNRTPSICRRIYVLVDLS